MVLNFYIVICVLSLICCVLFFWNRRNYYPVLYTMIYVLSFLAQLCYVFLSLSKDAREAIAINKFLYISGCYLPMVGFMLVLSICQIKFPKWVNFLLLLLTSAVFGLSLTAGFSPVFYANVDIETRYGVTVLVKEYGPLHSFFYIMIAFFLVATLVVTIYSWIKKPQISKKDLAIVAFMQVFSIFCYFIGRQVSKQIEWMALADLVDEIGFLLVMNHIGLYQVDDLVLSSTQNEGKVGYIALDFKKQYLSATDIAKRFLPEISKNAADHVIEDETLRESFDRWIDQYAKEQLSINHTLHKDKFIYLVHVGDLYDGTEKRGYLLQIVDDTEHQERVEDIERYNMSLNRELMAKAKLIKELESRKGASEE